jgi:CheY-like chemotaxis protein
MSARRHKGSGDKGRASYGLKAIDSPLHIFHVDDSPDDHLLLKSAAEMARVPFSWDVAECVDSAICYLRTLLALDQKTTVTWPDLVLLDISLPRGGGFKVLEFIRAIPELNSLRVVVLSGSHAPGIAERAYELGADSVLLKPAAFRDLVKLTASLYANWSTGLRMSPNVSPAVDLIPLAVSPAQ